MAGRHQLGIARQEPGGNQLNTKSMTSKKLISQKPKSIKPSPASSATSDNPAAPVTAQTIALDLASPGSDKSFDQAAIGKFFDDKCLNDKSLNDSSLNDSSLNNINFAGSNLADSSFADSSFADSGLADSSFNNSNIADNNFNSSYFNDSGPTDSSFNVSSFPDGDFDDKTSQQNIQICNGQGSSPPVDVDDVYRHCRNLGMRLSRQRRMVLDLLWVEKSHLSARDIFERLNNLGRNIGHTSVYQNLEALQSAGVIECLDRANGRLYGYRSDPHSHLTCTKTGNIQDLDVELPAELLRQIEAHTGYAIESYTMQFTGHPL
jgi:Fur family ferric uptake transcriptional regulator